MTELAAQARFLIRKVDADRYDWRRHARPSQREPRDYLVHAIVAGRGSGKTRTGSETVRRWANRRVGTYAVIAKNDREVRRICFEAPKAGLLAVIPPQEVAGYKKSAGETELTLTNGSRIMAFSAETPDNMRGYAFDGVWCVAAGTLVDTARGPVPVEQVTTADRVRTRSGWRQVTAGGRTKVAAECVRITTDHGALTCTPEHLLWSDGAWRQARDVRPGSTLVSW